MSERMLPIGVGIVGVGIIAAAVGVKIAQTPALPSTSSEPVVAQASRPLVLPVPQPQLLVVQEPPPPPPPLPEPLPPPEPRAAAPQIDLDCQLAESDDATTSCLWDDGFPAISADGSTIAARHTIGNGDTPSLEVRFVDVATSRVIDRDVVLDPKLFEDSLTLSARERTTAERRAARVRQKLGGYRSLARVQTREGDLVAPSNLRADVAGDRMRLVDVPANTVLFERSYEARAAGLKPQIEDGEVYCTSEHTAAIDSWWDARTRTLLAEVTYNNGGELCDWIVVDHAHRL